MYKTIIVFMLLAALFAGPGWAQSRKVITNEDVVAMVKAGLSESVIVLALQGRPTKFDTTPAALIHLKEQGVPALVIEAMLGGVKEAAPAAPVAPKSAPAGVFYRTGEAGWEPIERISSFESRAVGELASNATYGIKETRTVCVLLGAHAAAQLTERRPVFRIAGLGVSPGYIFILALRKNPNRRDAEVGRDGLFKKKSTGFRERDVFEVEITRLGDDLLEVKPKKDLKEGEYLLFTGEIKARGSTNAGEVRTPNGRVIIAGPLPLPAISSVAGYDFGILKKQN